MIKLGLLFLLYGMFYAVSCSPTTDRTSGSEDGAADDGKPKSFITRPHLSKRPLTNTLERSAITTLTTSDEYENTDLEEEETVVPHEYPFMVSIQYESGRHLCGGSLISRQHVLTAAHCVRSLGRLTATPEEFRIGVGLHDLRAGSDINYFYVESITVHPDYNGDLNSIVNDIAIFKLAIPISKSLETVVARISLPKSSSKNLRAGSKVTAIGWGATQEAVQGQPFLTSNILQREKFTILNTSECARRSSETYHPNTQICIDSSSSAVCKGDGGGPLFRELPSGVLQLEGIISYGLGKSCVQPKSAQFFTRVSKYVGWINTVIRRNDDVMPLTQDN